VSATAVFDATSDLGVRFRLVGLLPTVVVGLFALALYWSGAPASAPDPGQVTEHAENLSAWEGFIIALALLVAALIVEPLQISLVRALEGYWGTSFIARMLSTPGVTFHRWRRTRFGRMQQRKQGGPRVRSAAVRENAARRYRSYPPADAVLPTKLGNQLRAAEYRAGNRYGFDTVAMWPRLYPLLPAGVTAGLNDFRDQLDLAARFCAMFLLATLVSIAFLAAHGWWLMVAVGTLLLAWMSYRGALAAASGYGQAVESAFDLHRFDLVRALHLPVPGDLASERASNRMLSNFILLPEEYTFTLDKRPEQNFVYEHGDDEAAKEQGPEA